MGHVLFAAPRIAHFHLHDRLARGLSGRGHRITVLAADVADQLFFTAQGQTVAGLRPARQGLRAVPSEAMALRDRLLAGQRVPNPRAAHRDAELLARRASTLVRLLESDPPDLVLVHQGRSGLHRMIDYVCREFGCHVLHIGEGLLPGTLQWDPEGVDGDASTCARRAVDYRDTRADTSFLSAALSAWLAHFFPPPLSRTTVRPPALAARGRAVLRCLLGRHPQLALRCVEGWREATTAPPMPGAASYALPEVPFLAVLLQHPACPRLRLDAPADASSVDLAVATAASARRLPEPLPVVAIAPPEGVAAADRRRLVAHRIAIHPASAAQQAISTGLGVVTVNHPLGLAAVLCGTPLVHTGRSPYAVPGVGFATALDRLPDDLPKALDVDAPTLRERFLTRLLGVDHVWCSADHPDYNGLNGLIRGIEQRMSHRGPDELSYRVGPVWPLEPLRKR